MRPFLSAYCEGPPLNIANMAIWAKAMPSATRIARIKVDLRTHDLYCPTDCTNRSTKYDVQQGKLHIAINKKKSNSGSGGLTKVPENGHDTSK